MSVLAAPDGDFVGAAALDSVRYSQVWEDHAVLQAGLGVRPGDDVLSIAGAGCNVLALLLAGPRSVVAVDVNPAQTALLELKLAGLRRLAHADFAALIGAREGADRLALYARLRDALTPRARAFWDGHQDDLAAGATGCGLLDGYLRDVREGVIAAFVDPGAVRRLLELDDPRRQAQLFAREIETPELEAAFRAAGARQALSGRARDASQFRYVAVEDVGGHFWRRFRHVCTAVPARGNFYLEWFLTGRYGDLRTGPPFLRPAAFERLRALAGRVTIVTDDLGRALQDRPVLRFSKANLSDMLEYVSEEAADELLGLLASRMRPRGRIAYWNMLVPRGSSELLRDRLLPFSREAGALWRRDRCFFYRAFRLEEVR